MSAGPEIRDLARQPSVIETAITDWAGIGARVDRAFSSIFERLGQLGVSAADAPYIRYLDSSAERLEIELGVPVPEGVLPLEGLEQASLPPGRTAVLRHVGPYEQLRAACERLFEWVEAHGESAAGPFWESYVTNPATEPDPAKRITDIYLPLR